MISNDVENEQWSLNNTKKKPVADFLKAQDEFICDLSASYVLQSQDEFFGDPPILCSNIYRRCNVIVLELERYLDLKKIPNIGL